MHAHHKPKECISAKSEPVNITAQKEESHISYKASVEK